MVDSVQCISKLVPYKNRCSVEHRYLYSILHIYKNPDVRGLDGYNLISHNGHNVIIGSTI